MRWSIRVGSALAAVAASAAWARADRMPVACLNLATEDLAIDGLLDEWPRDVAKRIGMADDGQVALRCAWDGTALALALDIRDDRLIRLARGPGEQDHVVVKVAAGNGRPLTVDVYPGNAMAKPRISKPARVEAADSLQPKGFSVEVRVPAAQLSGFSAATPALALDVTFVDADKAAGGDTSNVGLAASVALSERASLFDDFLRTTRLEKSDIKLDQFAELDPGRRGTERVVAGGTVIGVITDQFAYVTLPAARARDVKKVELLPLRPRGAKVIAATVRQSGNGGARELLMLWTVSGGQLQPLRNIELRKELDRNVLSSTWKIVPAKGRRPAELVVEPAEAIGFTAQTWNEAPAEDADSIIVPWDGIGGAAYAMDGESMTRRTFKAPKKRR